MIRVIFFYGLMMISNGVLGQDWVWANAFGGESTEVLSAVDIAADGSLLMGGSYQETIEFGSTSLQSRGEGDVFLTKLSESGNVQWAISAGSESNDQTLAVKIDNEGNVLWLGQYWVKAYFGTDSIDSGVNSKAYFLAKYSPLGELQWLQNIRGTSTKVVSDVAVDAANGVYLTGYFSDTLLLGDTSLVAMAMEDGFVWKLDSGGEVEWGRSYGTSGMVRPGKIASSPMGELVIAGELLGSVSFGADMLSSVTTDFDVFVAKLDAEGVSEWGRIGTGVFDNFLRALAVNEVGEIFLSGHFIGVLDIDGNSIATPGFFDNLYLIKLAANGEVIWARGLDDSEFNDPSFSFGIALRGDMVWMTGQYLSSLKIDDLSINGADFAQGFVATFDMLTGVATGLVSLTGDDQVSGRLIKTGNQDQIILGGVFVSQVNLGGEGFNSNGGTDIFIGALEEMLTTVEEYDSRMESVLIFPNPVHNYLNIQLAETEEFVINIYNALGVLQMQSANTQRMFVGGLPSGIYNLSINIKNEILTYPFIKL